MISLYYSIRFAKPTKDPMNQPYFFEFLCKFFKFYLYLSNLRSSVKNAFTVFNPVIAYFAIFPAF